MQTYIEQISSVLIERYKSTRELSWLISGPSAAGLNFALVARYGATANFIAG